MEKILYIITFTIKKCIRHRCWWECRGVEDSGSMMKRWIRWWGRVSIGSRGLRAWGHGDGWE